MKTILKSMILAAPLIFATAAQADNTGTRVIERIQLKTTTGYAYFRPVGLGSWGGVGCPDAQFAYIKNTDPEFDNVISLAVAAKLNGSPVSFQGTCLESGNYLLIDYMYLQ